MPGGIPPIPPGGIPPGAADFEDAMTSSIRRIMTAASAALEIACVFTRNGSTTPALSMSAGLPAYDIKPECLLPRLMGSPEVDQHINRVKP